MTTELAMVDRTWAAHLVRAHLADLYKGQTGDPSHPARLLAYLLASEEPKISGIVTRTSLDVVFHDVEDCQVSITRGQEEADREFCREYKPG